MTKQDPGRRYIFQAAAVASLGSLMGCATPDVTSEIQALSAFASETNTILTKELDSAAKQDLRDAEDRLIAGNQTVFNLRDCDNTDSFGLARDCRIETYAKVTREGAVLLAMNALEGYLKELSILASTEIEDEIARSVAQLNAALASAEDSQLTALAKLGQRTRKDREPVAQALTYLAKQYRLRQLRAILGKGQKTIPTMLRTAAANIASDDDLLEKRLVLVSLEAEAQTALDEGRPQAFRAAFEELKTAHAELMEAEEKSLTNRLRIIANMHEALVARFQSGGSLSDLDKALGELLAVKQAFEE